MSALVLIAAAAFVFTFAAAFAAMRGFLKELRELDRVHYERLVHERVQGFHDGIAYASGNGVYGHVIKEGDPPDPTPPERDTGPIDPFRDAPG